MANDLPGTRKVDFLKICWLTVLEYLDWLDIVGSDVPISWGPTSLFSMTWHFLTMEHPSGSDNRCNPSTFWRNLASTILFSETFGGDLKSSKIFLKSMTLIKGMQSKMVSSWLYDKMTPTSILRWSYLPKCVKYYWKDPIVKWCKSCISFRQLCANKHILCANVYNLGLQPINF